ncbi:enoyl-CoA hydratase/isomerase [Thecamonas trahens ATCC 50062]|uniref:Enoyl-CoA hydratase/isomerase n=1 Tax=Thecamonas trahens ATCC 50062 TaxID=461836 RepID=A0A0L0D831_THETB|nr:enoyl-CoA hydratase/isomerase [Thecamonas trahens ATCC 50062]KNC48226.1 enoyl-CoA hydratase/isomerase [Thecamonas trahens ATCC 50062]|eukprot:XP_013758795.1 enoyl-CoA hydratase/isomerase [Thecamonas trahens ATCC 50062]
MLRASLSTVLARLPAVGSAAATTAARGYSGVVSETDTRGVTTVTLNKPAVHNAFDAELSGALRAEFNRLAQCEETRVVVLRGAGKSFSAGADLEYMKAMGANDEAANYKDALELADMMRSLRFLPKPTLALVHGATFGGGVGLVAACDVAFGTERASFCFSEVKLGLIPAVISPYCVAALGERAAGRYFISAEVFKGKKAHELGLLHEVYESDEAMNHAADAFIDHLLGNGSQAMAAAKQLLHTIRGQPIDTPLIEETSRAIAAQRVSPEAQARLAAFLKGK